MSEILCLSEERRNVSTHIREVVPVGPREDLTGNSTFQGRETVGRTGQSTQAITWTKTNSEFQELMKRYGRALIDLFAASIDQTLCLPATDQEYSSGKSRRSSEKVEALSDGLYVPVTVHQLDAASYQKTEVLQRQNSEPPSGTLSPGPPVPHTMVRYPLPVPLNGLVLEKIFCVELLRL